MKIPRQIHRQRPLRVHDIAHDFDLLDVWHLPVRGQANDFAMFTTLMRNDEPPTSGVTGMLFKLRSVLGRLLSLDEPTRRPIPGCSEKSVADRLPTALREQVPRFDPKRDFQRIYSLPSEELLEISNATVHALMHLAWVTDGDDSYHAEMAVYCKSRGWFGRAYMALISPFRHFIVYPALMRHISRKWTRLSAPRRSPAAAG